MSGDLVEQFRHLYRFGDEVVVTDIAQRNLKVSQHVRRNDDRGCFPQIGVVADRFGRFESIHFGHVCVEQHQRHAVSPELCDGIPAVFGFHRADPGLQK